MDYYKIGRKYADKGRVRYAADCFEKGFLKGSAKCAYGAFALKMSCGEDARSAWERFVGVFGEIQAEAENGDREACFIMGRCFETGCGGEQDMKKALLWYERAAALGSLDGVFNLGCAYCYDDSVLDLEKGVRCFRYAAGKNNKAAQFNLAHVYELMGNEDLALFWYKRARCGGNAEMKGKYLQHCVESQE